MRVALVTTNLQPNNGWATLAVKRGEALRQLGVEVVAITCTDDGPPEAIHPARVHRVLPRPLIGGVAAARLLALAPAIRKLTADCDLIDVVAEPAIMACLAGGLSRPVVVTACGSYIPAVVGAGPARWAFRGLFKRASIHAISGYTAQRVAQALGSAQPPVIVPGVDYNHYQRARPRPEKLGPTVLSVAALKKRKGIHVLIDAIALARRSIPDIQCVLAGKISKAGYIGMLRKRIAGHGLEDHILMAGHLPDEEVTGWYQTADVFAMPSLSGRSHFEGFGLVILEANACGLPAIGTRESGNESAIEDGVTGYLVEQNSPETLAERIVAVLKDRAERDRLSADARAFAKEHSWAHSAAEVLRFYEDVLKNRQRGG